MAFAPASSSKKRSLFSAPAPNFKDFNGPPDGDYARYVEGLMQWSLQEQERLRLKALGDKARSSSDSEWGRESAKPAVTAALPISPATQPGSVDNAVERWKRKAQAQAAKRQQSTAAVSAPTGRIGEDTSANAGPKTKAKGLGIFAIFAMFALAAIFAPGLLPFAIIGWVVLNVIRAVRAASSSKQS